MVRQEHLDKIKTVRSPLLLLDKHLDTFISSHVDNLPIDSYLDFANRLRQLDNAAAKTRAEFIVRQCSGDNSPEFFLKYCESWGIPIFEEEILIASDFKNGFLHTFRDHSTSWCEDQQAREWFYNHIEARFTKRYEFWACDNGPDEMLLDESGDYKTILWTLVTKHHDYYALVSPEFTKPELKKYFDAYDPEQVDLEKDELLEIITDNPNWST